MGRGDGDMMHLDISAWFASRKKISALRDVAVEPGPLDEWHLGRRRQVPDGWRPPSSLVDTMRLCCGSWGAAGLDGYLPLIRVDGQ